MDQKMVNWKKDNVVDADFEDVKEDKEKAPKIINMETSVQRVVMMSWYPKVHLKTTQKLIETSSQISSRQN